jgi:D-apionolactonase
MNDLSHGAARLSRNLLRYGSEASLPEPIILRTGALSLVYEEGGLRSIKLGKHELVRRIYAAVRDRDWGTVPGRLSDLQIETGAEHFHISYSAVHSAGDIHFAWQGTIWGGTDANGASEISFNLRGQALSSFFKNRIGLCILLPISLAGAACSIEHIGEVFEQASFPLEVDSRQPPPSFSDLVGLDFTDGEVAAALRFAGDAFELEDQRNWTDASFKIYSTPLRMPYPVEIQAGTPVNQSVSLQVKVGRRGGKSRRTVSKAPARPLMVSIEHRSGVYLPRLGLGCASHDHGLTGLEIERLRALRLDHVRADLRLAEGGYPDALRRAVSEATALGVSLHLGLHFSSAAEIQAFVREYAPELLEQSRRNVNLWLVYPTPELYQGGTPLREMLTLAKKHLRGAFAAGTDHDLIFLLRNPPPTRDLQLVTFAINPQVHTSDNTSVMETLEAQVHALRRAHQMSGARPVMVSPITLKPRNNPYASPASSTSPSSHLKADELPPQVDSRQMSLFTAAWTVGSLSALVLGGAQSLTYYETTGWRGIMETEAGSPMPELFRSIPGSVFPVYHVFAAAGDFSGGEALAVTSSDPQKVQALGLQKGGRLRVLVANLSPAEQQVRLQGLVNDCRLRLLDELSAGRPQALAGAALPSENCPRDLRLLPYAVAIIDEAKE